MLEVRLSKYFKKKYKMLDKNIQNLFKEKLKMLLNHGLDYPSLRIHELKGRALNVFFHLV